jgi:hypothetical protein
MRRLTPPARVFLLALLVILAATGLLLFGSTHHTCPFGPPCDPGTKGWLWTTPASLSALVVGAVLMVVSVWISRTAITKALAIGAALAFLAAPLILYVGRTRRLACPRFAIGPCDPGFTSPDWILPAVAVASSIGVALGGAAAWRASRSRLLLRERSS